VNPRQRRGLLLIAISGLGLVVVFVLVAGYVSDVRKEVDPKVSLLALAKPVEAHQAITDDMVKTVTMPERWAPPSAMRDPGELVGLVAGTDLQPDTLLQKDMLTAPPQLAPGQRELAILVDAETGVAGKIGPDSVVDLIATYPGSQTRAPESRVVVPGARIIEVGQPRLKGGNGLQREQAADPGQVVPITFALTPEQALVVSYAESNAAEVRLALLRPGDAAELTKKQRVYSREPDPEPAQ
jgi:pilus assembly protein CpaB